MSINFSHFDQSAIQILKRLAANFPTSTEISFHDIFPGEDATNEKQEAHISTIAFLRHEDFISHEMSSVSSFILTKRGLELFNENIIEHLKIALNE